MKDLFEINLTNAVNDLSTCIDEFHKIRQLLKQSLPTSQAGIDTKGVDFIFLRLANVEHYRLDSAYIHIIGKTYRLIVLEKGQLKCSLLCRSLSNARGVFDKLFAKQLKEEMYPIWDTVTDSGR
ncbi:MAG: hypothetical protein GY765_16280 [bacterium]|nr:hypothetical protein [bacterium]